MLNYVFAGLNPFVRSTSLRSLGLLEHFSKLVSRFFSRKEMLAKGISVSKSLAYPLQNTPSLTSRCNVSFDSLGARDLARFPDVFFAFDTYVLFQVIHLVTVGGGRGLQGGNCASGGFPPV